MVHNVFTAKQGAGRGLANGKMAFAFPFLMEQMIKGNNVMNVNNGNA